MNVLAFDLGASSGRAVIGHLEQGELQIKEIHRFSNDPVQVGPHLHWDILRLFFEIKQGILKAVQLGYNDIESLAIDTWAVDFGLLDKNGELLANPYHYRNDHTNGLVEEVNHLLSSEEIFSKTGIQFMPINTIYHLYAMKKADNVALHQAEDFMMIPDLLRYFLTGVKSNEVTNATSTQLFNTDSMDWDDSLIKTLGLPEHIFKAPVKPGTVVGKVTQRICKELKLEEAIPVVTVGEHDTASAVVAVPHVGEESFAYLSCGTWSLLGTEVSQPIKTKQALEWNMTNEGGVDDTFRLLKNIMGLWLQQECMRVWEKEGESVTYQQLNEAIEKSPPFKALIDPDDQRFIKPENMPEAIQQYCFETNQEVPQTKGEILRCVLESLALKYRFVLERLEKLTNEKFTCLYMVGGGIQNRLLSQFTANAIQKPIYAGPIEATSIGNLLTQYKGLGYIKNLQESRNIVKNSFPITPYSPADNEEWNHAYRVFKELIDT
ncbi:rhamnulokinase [Halobacillus kuroshimensis]|uniref:rhamnulokinase n=1 Tax=Halobacillus kuroshimensis TaxID=302481 RepID=UPI0004824F9E|nr:rhamnulokinase [Halobacillus kuroshimensis]